MKLDAFRFAAAFATTWASAGLVCALVYKASPGAYNRAANFLLHTDAYDSTRALGWGHVVVAVAAWWLIAAVLAGCAAILYNRSAGGRAAAAA